MKYLYITLIMAHTGLGRAARLITGYEYTHIAVSTDRSLTDFLSFSRRRHSQPFDAGFMHEKRDYYAFGKHDFFKAKVFKIPVSEERFKKIAEFIRECEEDKELIFNLFSMATMPVIHGFRIYKTYNCMSFTAKVIQLSGAVSMNKPYYKYSIKDMDRLLERFCFFEGAVKRKQSEGYDEYMRGCGISEIIRSGTGLVCALTKRILLYGCK